MGIKRKRPSEEIDEQIKPAVKKSLRENENNGEPGPPRESTTQNRRSLFIRSLSATTTSEALSNFFSHSYPIKHATVVQDKATGKSKGFGFVTFTDEQDAIAAQTTLNGTQLHGRPLRIDFAQPRQRRAGDEELQTVCGEARKSQDSKPTSLSKLIVRNLAWTVKREAQLADLFSEFGKIRYVNIPKKESGLSPGFGFVAFVQPESARKAVEAMNGKELYGRSLAVDWAVEKQTWEDMQSTRPQIVDTDSDGTPSKTLCAANQQPEPIELGAEPENSRRDVTRSNVPGTKMVSHGPIGLGASQDDRLALTLFVSNVSFTATDQTLYNHFATFGRLQAARIVRDGSSGQSKGTAFICFKDPDALNSCLQEAAKLNGSSHEVGRNKSSILEDSSRDPCGRLTLDGRVLRVFRAVDKSEAVRLSVSKTGTLDNSSTDRRRLYLLNEGRIPVNGASEAKFSPAEIALREQNLSQRRLLLNRDSSLLLSLTRLSIRNLPKHFTAKTLKALAREAVLGFAKDVKKGLRKPLSKEENARGGQEMRLAEKVRKAKGKGIVRQAKVIFENRDGTKVSESTGIGRSRGYGFIEYSSHRWALMGLRWLNGHLVREDSPISGSDSAISATQKPGLKRRLIVEFAIENAQVVTRRLQREATQNHHPKIQRTTRKQGDSQGSNPLNMAEEASKSNGRLPSPGQTHKGSAPVEGPDDHRRSSIIGRKRMARKAKQRV